MEIAYVDNRSYTAFLIKIGETDKQDVSESGGEMQQQQIILLFALRFLNQWPLQ